MIAYILACKNEIDTVGSQENISQDIDESPNYDAMTAYIGNSNIESDKQIVKAEHILRMRLRIYCQIPNINR